MTKTSLITALCAARSSAARPRQALAEDVLKVAIPQRGAWDAGVAELGERGGIFKKHGLKLEILYAQAGPESIQALIGGSMDIATASGVSAAVGTFAKGAPIRIIGIGDDRRARSLLVCADRLADQDGRGFQRQDRGVLVDRLVEPCGAAGAHRAIQADRQADLDRQHRRDHHADHDRSGRCRLRRGAVRARSRRGRQDPDHRDRQRCRVAAQPHRARQPHQREHAQESPRRPGALQSRLCGDGGLDVFRPGALKHYGEYSKLPEKIVLRVRNLIPKANMATGKVEGIDAIMADAVAGKFIPAPLSAEQVKELIQIP